MEKKDRLIETSGYVDDKGRSKTIEVYDRGKYTETITKVESEDGVDLYVDKEKK